MKKVFKMAFFVSLALVLVLVTPFIFGAFFSEPNPAGSVGIIGGADGPTAIFITSTLMFENPFFWALCIATASLIASAIGFFASKRK